MEMIPVLITCACLVGWVIIREKRRPKKVNQEEELEKMYKLRDYFNELQFKHPSIHDRVLKELTNEIECLERGIFQELGKAAYEKKKGK